MQATNIQSKHDVFRSSLGAIFLLAFCLLTVVNRFIAAEWPVVVSGLLLVFYLALNLRAIKVSAWAMLSAMAIIFGISLAVFGPDHALFFAAFNRGIFIAFYVFCLSMLQIPCQRSGVFKGFGSTIVSQPDSRRYFSLAIGAQIFGALLSMGAIGLLGTAARSSVNHGADGTLSQQDHDRLQRMTLSIFRGFAPLALWSPTSVTLVVILSAFRDLTWFAFLPYALLGTAAFVGLGWLFDRRARTSQTEITPAGSIGTLAVAFLRTLPIIIGITIFVVTLTWALDITPIFSLTIAVPVCSAIWLLSQNIYDKSDHPVAASKQIIQREFVRMSDRFRPDLGIFLATGAISVLVGPLLNIGGLFEQILSTGIPQGVFLFGICLIICALATIGVNPFLTLLVTASTLVEVDSFTLSSLITALALMMTWAASISISPFMSVTIFLANSVNLPANLISLRLNFKFIVVWMCLVFIWLMVVTL